MLILLPLLFCASAVAHVLYYFGIGPDGIAYVYKLSFGAFQLMGVWWIYNNGTLRKSRFRNVIYIGIGTYWIAYTFVLQHWPGGRLMLLVSGVCLAAGYGIHFLKKGRRKYFDWLKLSWVTLLLIVIILGAFYDHGLRIWISWIFNVNSIILIGLFYCYSIRKKEPGRFELSDDRSAVFEYRE